MRGVQRVPSPNCDDRPPDTVIDLLVVHGISLPSGIYGGPYIERLFTNRLDPAEHASFRGLEALRVSAHCLIRRGGELVQYVPFTRRAWHAGVSAFCGRAACNDFSIGIELEGSDHDPYEELQYQRLVALSKILMSAWPAISPDRIVGHSAIAPGRKTDPGPAFDWARFGRLLAQ